MSALEDIPKDITQNKVMLYMKGTPEQPMCGFSAQVVNILKARKVEFGSRNVLASDELRRSIKEFSDWPTIPQLYVNGRFIGGCDIVTEMNESGELDKIMRD